MSGRTLRWAGFGALFLGAAVAGHLVVLDRYPKRVMAVVMERVKETAGGANTLAHAPLVTPASRNVVRPSPDLVYSICVYDLSEGPVEISFAPSGGYSSLSLYDSASNNFFVVNDRQLRGDRARVVITRPRQGSAADPATEEALHAVSPTPRGIALIRRLATPEDVAAAALDARRGDACRPVPSGSPASPG